MQPAGLVEQLLGLVALHPFLEQFQVLGLGGHVGERHLVRAEGAFGRQAVDLFRAGPALGRAEDDHRPERALLEAVGARRRSGSIVNLGDDLVERGGHQLVHRLGIVALDEIGLVAVAAEQLVQFLVADARQHRRVGDLVAVEVQDRQHGAVVDGIEELVRVPTGGQRAGLRLAVADDAGDDQIGIVEGGAVGVRRASSPVRRLRGSSRAFPGRRGWECRRETRTA